MFYRVRNNKVYDWGDYKYESDCSELKDYTSSQYEELSSYFTISKGVLVPPSNEDEILLAQAKTSKYTEITDAYDYANQYYVINLYDNIYGNVSWLNTWTKVINLCESNNKSVIPSAVRYYKKAVGQSKFTNVSIQDVSLDTLKKQKQLLENVQFSILQPKRNEYYAQLESATTIEDVNLIEVNFGLTINEQDQSDVAEKVDL
jgi:hypothetical protein